MFSYCSNLDLLKLNNFDTVNAINMSRMFYNCTSLKELYIINFSTRGATYRNDILYGCSSLVNMYCKDKLIITQFNNKL